VPLAVSTMFVQDVTGAEAKLRKLVETGLEAVEIEYRVSASELEGLIPLLKRAGIRVTSLHNPVPRPDTLPIEAASGDRMPFSSPERETRRQATALALATLQTAHDVEAGATVFHLGFIPDLMDRWPEITRFFDEDRVETEEAEEVRAELVQLRYELAGPFVDRAMLALEPLLIPAERLGVTIGIEIRNHLHEVPSPNEIARILDTFRGAPIGYWHDVGHAVIQERVGLLSEQAVLERFKDSLVGVHLHDVREREDHLAPGQGTVDFTTLAPFVEEVSLFKVLEVKPAPAGQVREGVEVLRSAGVL